MKNLRKQLLPLAMVLLGVLTFVFGHRSVMIYFGPVEGSAGQSTHLLLEADLYLASHEMLTVSSEADEIELGSTITAVHSSQTTSTYFFPLYEGPVDTVRLRTENEASRPRLAALRVTDPDGNILREIDPVSITQVNLSSSNEFVVRFAEPLKISPRKLNKEQDRVVIATLFGRMLLFPGLPLVALAMTVDGSRRFRALALSVGLSVLLAAVGALRVWRSIDHLDLSRPVLWEEAFGVQGG